jgi:Secretion system C-terminal sorting domain
MKRFFTFTLSLSFLIPALLFSQNKAVLTPDGKLLRGDLRDVMNNLKSEAMGHSIAKQPPYDIVMGVAGTIDTLGYDGAGGANFGFYGQDVMLQWIVAPADMTVKQVAFLSGTGTDFGPPPATTGLASVKIVSVDWSMEDLASAGVQHWGYYEASGNGQNDATPFTDNLDKTGEWVDTQGDGRPAPFGSDLWGDLGEGWPVTDIVQNTWYYISLNDNLGFEVEMKQGDIMGIVVKNDDIFANNAPGTYYFPFAAGDNSIPAFKYYADGRNTPGPSGDYGWWSRLYKWPFVAVVDLTGDRGPVIDNVTELNTTLSTDPQPVTLTATDDNPSGGPAGVASVVIVYQTIFEGDTSAWLESAMTGTEPNYSGAVPGQPKGSTITWKIKATDVQGFSTETAPTTYGIYKPNSQFLFLYDANSATAFSVPTMYGYFWGYNAPADSIAPPDFFDTQSLGAATPELLENYNAIFWYTGFYPETTPNGPMWKAWLEGGTAEHPRNLFLTGFDYGCEITGDCSDTTFAPGTFEYDNLGIATLGPQDVGDATADPYPINPVADDPITGYMAKIMADSGYGLIYDVSQINAYMDYAVNYADEIVPADHATVYMTDPNNSDTPIGIRASGDYWKASYFQFDPYCLAFTTETDTTNVTDYFGNILNTHLEWWALSPVSAIEKQISNVPGKYALRQNYPNPFNPSTTIEYTIQKTGDVEIMIYDVTGRQVARLVKGVKSAGTHSVSFNAKDLSSGLYVYTIKTKDFTSSKKMLLIK